MQSSSVHFCHCFLGCCTSSVPEWCLSSALFMLYYWWWCTKSSAMLKGHWPAIQSALLCLLFKVIFKSKITETTNSCKMRLPLVYFFLLIVFYFFAKEGHWSFNDKCHHLCVRNDSAVWTSAKILLSPLHSQISLCFVKDLSTFKPWKFSSTQYKVIIVLKIPTFTEIYGIHPPCAGVLTPHWERPSPELGKECLSAFYCDSAPANYKE